MKEIKFRMWDKRYKQMAIYKLDEIENIPLKNMEIMQYTGGKDINKKEIYEGDILKVNDEYGGMNFIGVVEFQNLSFTINQSDCMNHYRWIDYECEVIGNIHENPELLEELNAK